MTRRLLLGAVASLAVLVLAFLVLQRQEGRRRAPSAVPSDVASSRPGPVATATYRCDAGRMIRATFYEGRSDSAPAPGRPPTRAGSVHVRLGDRGVTLHRTLSADGLRYSDGDPATPGAETLVFWSRGNGALVLEHGEQRTYTGCVRVADDPGGLPRVYASGSRGFSIRYPAGWTVDTTYRYRALGPGRSIAGVSITVPDSLASGTNLAPDTRLSVETLPGAASDTASCTANRFLSHGAGASDTTADGTDYSLARRTDAGAGNRYRETVWALPETRPCTAVRYLVHWTVLENYPQGVVTAFDQRALAGRFDAMRRTLVMAP